MTAPAPLIEPSEELAVTLAGLEWPGHDAAGAVRALVGVAAFEGRRAPKRKTGGDQRAGDAGTAPGATVAVATSGGQGVAGVAAALGETIRATAEACGVDAEPIDVPAADPLRLLRQATPLLVHLAGGSGLLVIWRVRGGTATLVTRNGPVKVATGTLEDAFRGAVVGDTAKEVAATLAAMPALGAERRRAAMRLLMAPTLVGQPVAAGWRLRRVSTSIRQELRAAKLYPRMAAVLAGYLAQFALFVGLWREVAAHSFPGTAGAAATARPWMPFFILLAAWALVQLWASSALSRLALDAGAVVRAALLRGALRLDAGRMRVAGVGQLLGRALEADALDALALGGGVEAVMGLFELAVGGAVLVLGVAPRLSTAALALAAVAVVALTRLHARRLGAWNEVRRRLTHDLVERMVGHRTVLIQDRPAARARADDLALQSYDGLTRAVDAAEVWLAVLVPRAWLLAGLLVLAPAAVGGLDGDSGAGASLALSMGGVWLTYGAWRRLGIALPTLAQAREAWRQIAPLVADDDETASARVRRQGDGAAAQPDTSPLLVAEQVWYRYPDRSALALRGVSLTVSAGDRILIEGASGGGKSTLAALMTGLKAPSGGSLRLRGQEQSALGLARWRGAVGGAPQFHDNHVFGANLLFNLLMGRRWPPRQEDFLAAEKVCRDLGLGELLDRMPSGLQQQVGETGWQLSHGEQSRIFIARSLLQTLDMRVLDESFAALDPRTLDQVMAVVLERREALIVIAHP